MLDCLYSIIDSIFDKLRCMILLASQDRRSHFIDNLFLRSDWQKFIMIVAMAEPEKHCGDRPSLGKLIKCLVLQELFHIGLMLDVL